MRERHITTQALLLRRTFLPNDDAILVFLTPNSGVVTAFASRLRKSKKKAAELDFFRLLTVTLHKGRSSYKLRDVRTESVITGFSRQYEHLEMGFSWLSLLETSLPEDTAISSFFQKIVALFFLFHAEHDRWAAIFFEAQLAHYHGLVDDFSASTVTWEKLLYKLGRISPSLFFEHVSSLPNDLFLPLESYLAAQKEYL